MEPQAASIATWGELARSMAGLARAFRDALRCARAGERTADATAQEIICKLLALWLLSDDEDPGCRPVLQADALPSSPAVRMLLKQAEELLVRADREAILRDFDGRYPGADPAIHFYERFLAEYDPERRMRRGVFYTPRPVVQFILRAVDNRLRDEFGLPDGLADISAWNHVFPSLCGSGCLDAPFVQIIDLAAGTGAFLIEIIDIVNHTMRAKWRAAGINDRRAAELWREYVPGHLLPRLHGFELMPAACALAHLNLSLKLRATGYLHDGELAVVRPGNSLELLTAVAPPEPSECNADPRPAFTIVLGNPPYSIRSRSGEGRIDALMADYKAGLAETNINALSDDYVRFLRLAHALIVRAGAGVVGMVTNNSFLEGVTHRRMRELLHRDFDRVEVLDLHGSVMRRAENPAGVTDQSVFDIQQGVAISILSRSPRVACPKRGHAPSGPDLMGVSPPQPPSRSSREPLVHRADLWGTREQKLRRLAEAASAGVSGRPPAAGGPIEWHPVACTGPYFLFRGAGGSDEEYHRWPSLADIFEVFSCGIKFRKDGLLVKNHFTREDVERMLADVASLPDGALMARYGFRETADWRLSEKRPLFATLRPEDIIEVMYRPFDIRHAFYPLDRAGRIIVRGDSRVDLMRHVLSIPNIGLLFNRQVVGERVSHFLVSRRPVSHGTFYLGNKGQDYFAPLYLLGPDGRPRANLKTSFMDQLGAALQSRADGRANRLPQRPAPSPEAVLHYLYAIVHSPTYRTRYAGPLKLGFPRIPFFGSAELFDWLCRLGTDLVGLHLMEDAYPEASWNRAGRPGPLKGSLCSLAGNGPAVVAAGYPKHREGRVYLNATRWFEGVAEDVWGFQVGGYCVCRKWLHDRRGRELSADDICHYGRIVLVLSETRRLMSAIDAAIEAHGGCESFQSGLDLRTKGDTIG